LQSGTQPVYFDFKRKRVLVGDHEQAIGDDQPWRLIERAIRSGTVRLPDCFLCFDEWRSERDRFNAARRFQVIVSKANTLLRPYGLWLSRIEKEIAGWTLKGWDGERHRSNASEAIARLQNAVKALAEGEIDGPGALRNALEVFELDPESLPAALFVIKFLNDLKDRTVRVPDETLRRIIRLLRQQESVYETAIAAIERCDMLRDADLDEQLGRCRSTLDEIRRIRGLASGIPQFREIWDGGEGRFDEIVDHVRAIQQVRRSGPGCDPGSHLKALLSSDQIRRAKDVVLLNVRRRCPEQWAKGDRLEEAFDSCLNRLILEKVDCGKLQFMGSLASYVKRSIPAMMLDAAFQAVYELSYSQFRSVQKLRRVRDRMSMPPGPRPADEEVARELGIAMRRLHLVQQWERQLGRRSFKEKRDGRPKGDEREDESVRP
jgi:hypothetical protein